MSATGYKPLSWNQGDNITKEKLNQMANNDQWLFDNIPRADYQALGVHKNEGIRIAAGVALIKASTKPWGFTDVHLSNFFSSGSTPIVTTGGAVTTHIRRAIISVNGFGRTHPDNRGFRIWVSLDQRPWEPNRIFSPFYVPWHAIGY